MNIIYIITTVLIIILHMLIYKNEKKLNLFSWLIITIGLFFCYNICTCVIISFVQIKSTLITLSIINLIMIFAICLKIYNDKKIQKYYINKMDIVAVAIIVATVILVAIKQYGVPINIKFIITDGSTHYWVADEFYKYSKLLLYANSDVIGVFNEKSLMPGAYINTGILFKVFSGIVEETYFCKLFTMFDIAMWCLSGLLMYALLSNNKKEEKKKIIPLIFSLIYMVGYPLNSLLSGFSYLQIGLNTIICIIYVMKQDVKSKYKDILLLILNFGLMFTYYYFAPVVFLSILIQKILEIRKNNEKVFSRNNILSIVISLIIPGMFGVMYFVIFQIIKFGINTIDYGNAINTPGDIYKGLILNIIIFLLISMVYIFSMARKRELKYSHRLLIISFTFLLILYVGMRLQKVSEYYYYKVYYMIWILLIVVSFEQIYLLYEKNKILTYIGIIIYCIGIFVSIIINKNILFFDIYITNFKEVRSDARVVVSNEEIEILEYYNKNIKQEDNLDNVYIYTAKMTGRARWIYVITGNPYLFIDLDIGEDSKSIQQFLENDKQYCIILKKDDCEEILNNLEDVDNIKILFLNDAGAVIEKIN